MNDLTGFTEAQAKRIEKARQRVIEAIGNNMDLYGVTHSIGHMYGNMYFANRPVTLDEMSAAMGMSKTSMSTGMRTLLDLNMIEKVWEKGARKDLYQVVPDWHKNFTDFFALKWRKAVEVNVASLRKSLNDLEALRQEYADDEALVALVDTDLAKLENALSYYRWLDRLIDALESGEIFQYIPKE